MAYTYIIDKRKINIEDVLNNSSNFRKDKYNYYKNQENKFECLAATYLIDYGLKKYGLREQDMSYGIGKNGKPYFINHSEIKFSISHSKNMAMVAMSDYDIGCDIQFVKRIDEDIYDKVLLDNEKKEILQIDNINLRMDKFFEYWVMKEAKLKKSGKGLSNDISSIDIEHMKVYSYTLKDVNEKYKYCISSVDNEDIFIKIL